MTVSTQGMQIRTGSRLLSETVELLSSMRFAISLLTVICIASVIGTVVKQHEPFINYVNQFGPFWADVFASAGLFSVYSAWWFLLILAFLVISTSLCIARNTPKIFADFKAYKENIREQSLKAFPHRAEGGLAETPEAAANRIGQTLLGSGWKVKLQSRETPTGKGWMVAAKTGAASPSPGGPTVRRKLSGASACTRRASTSVVVAVWPMAWMRLWRRNKPIRPRFSRPRISRKAAPPYCTRVSFPSTKRPVVGAPSTPLPSTGVRV